MSLLDKIAEFERLSLEEQTFITHFYEMSKKYDNKQISESCYALMLLYNRYGFTNTQAYLLWMDIIEQIDGEDESNAFDPLTNQTIAYINIAVEIIKGADNTLSLKDVVILIKNWLPFFKECLDFWEENTDMLLYSLMFSWTEAYSILFAEGYTYSVADTILKYLYAVQEDVEFKS
jgi:hypothetical protein